MDGKRAESSPSASQPLYPFFRTEQMNALNHTAPSMKGTPMQPLKIYRKRIIPAECVLLKDDLIVKADDRMIVTKWNTLKPKAAFSHGVSCYFLEHGIKVSKFYRGDGSLLYWYCDIVDYELNEKECVLTVTDLLADVIIYPWGEVRVADLDELADALDRGVITSQLMSSCLRRLHFLLSLIYRDKFERLQSVFNDLGL